MPSLPLPSSPRLRPLTLALGLLGALPLASQAQSLNELYNVARNYDAQVLAARALADSAQYRVAQAQGALLPSAQLVGSVGRAESDPATIDRTFGTTSQSVSVRGSYPLFNRGNLVDVDRARRSAEINQADLEIAEQDLIVRLAQAYFDVLTSQDSLAAAKANKTAIGEQLASAKRNFEVGTATITDTREAQARFDLASSQEIAADNDLRTKRITLDQLVGQPNVAPKPLAVPVALPQMAPNPVEEWVTLADGSHPGIRKAKLAFDVAKLDSDKARAGNLPTVNLVGSVGAQHASGSGAKLAGTNGTGKNASVGVELNYTLFSGGIVQNRIKETTVLEEKSRNDLEFARRDVAQRTRQAYFGTQSLQAQAKALEAAEASSKLALEATQLGYKVGVRVNLDVLNAQTQLFNTQRDLSKARYDTLITSLRLRQASGQLKPQDVAALDALLAR